MDHELFTDFHTRVQKVCESRMPDEKTLTFPNRDEVCGWIQSWATSNGIGEQIDVTSEAKEKARAFNQSSLAVLAWFANVGIRAQERPDTMFYCIASPDMVRAFSFLSCYCKAMTSNYTVFEGGRMSYVIAWYGDDWAELPLTVNRQLLANGFSAFLPGWKCCVCLCEMREKMTLECLWQCFHPVCSDCTQSMEFAVTCPLCRAPPFLIATTGAGAALR